MRKLPVRQTVPVRQTEKEKSLEGRLIGHTDGTGQTDGKRENDWKEDSSTVKEGRTGDTKERTENAWLIGELPWDVSGSRSGARSKRRRT